MVLCWWHHQVNSGDLGSDSAGSHWFWFLHLTASHHHEDTRGIFNILGLSLWHSVSSAVRQQPDYPYHHHSHSYLYPSLGSISDGVLKLSRWPVEQVLEEVLLMTPNGASRGRPAISVLHLPPSTKTVCPSYWMRSAHRDPSFSSMQIDRLAAGWHDFADILHQHRHQGRPCDELANCFSMYICRPHNNGQWYFINGHYERN